MEIIPNDKLRLEDIPIWSDDISKDVANIIKFGHTYNGYEDSSIEVSKKMFEKYEISSKLSELRTCLFLQQRAWRHWDSGPGGGQLLDESMSKEREYAKSLINKIREKISKGDRD